MKFRRQTREELPLNLTPLIDVVFLLLIFFMVSTTFTRESQLRVELPEASAEQTTPKADQMEIVIGRDGQYSVNNRVLINSQRLTLQRAILKLSNGDTEQPFVITADAKTPHEFVVRAMDVAGELGFQRLRITTRQREDE